MRTNTAQRSKNDANASDLWPAQVAPCRSAPTASNATKCRERRESAWCNTKASSRSGRKTHPGQVVAWLVDALRSHRAPRNVCAEGAGLQSGQEIRGRRWNPVRTSRQSTRTVASSPAIAPRSQMSWTPVALSPFDTLSYQPLRIDYPSARSPARACWM